MDRHSRCEAGFRTPLGAPRTRRFPQGQLRPRFDARSRPLRELAEDADDPARPAVAAEGDRPALPVLVAQIRQGEPRLAVAAILRAQDGEERLPLVDGQQAAVAVVVAARRERPGEPLHGAGASPLAPPPPRRPAAGSAPVRGLGEGKPRRPGPGSGLALTARAGGGRDGRSALAWARNSGDPRRAATRSESGPPPL